VQSPIDLSQIAEDIELISFQKKEKKKSFSEIDLTALENQQAKK
jgi:hypothetical protein